MNQKANVSFMHLDEYFFIYFILGKGVGTCSTLYP